MDLLIIHIGAGNHSSKYDSKYYQLIKKALVKENNGIETIKKSSQILEQSELTNTGYGSSLNILGEVSNDASFLVYKDGVVKYGSVHDIKSLYPVSETIDIFNKIDKLYHVEKYDKLGITKPKIINYSIKNYLYEMLKLKLEPVPNLLSDLQKKKYDIYKAGFLDVRLNLDDIQDTIGLIHYHSKGITTISASSGGNFLKMPGRVGCAGIIGSGIGIASNDTMEISCIASGNGEDIILLNLSNLLSNKLLNEPNTDIHNFLRLESENIPLNLIINDKPKLYIGLILLINNKRDNFQQLLYYHTTESFYFGYRHGEKKRIIQSRNTGDYVLGEVILKQ